MACMCIRKLSLPGFVQFGNIVNTITIILVNFVFKFTSTNQNAFVPINEKAKFQINPALFTRQARFCFLRGPWSREN